MKKNSTKLPPPPTMPVAVAAARVDFRELKAETKPEPAAKPEVREESPEPAPRLIKLSHISTGEELYALNTISEDNSCLIHSILRGLFKNYSGLTKRDKISLAQDYRRKIAERLQAIDPKTGETYYRGMFNGRIVELARTIPDYQLEYMVGELLSHSFLDHHLQEIISDLLDCDIYFISKSSGDVFIDTKEIYSLCYKGRNSIIIYHYDKHYETIGTVRSLTTYFTVFAPDDALIQCLNARLVNVIKRM